MILLRKDKSRAEIEEVGSYLYSLTINGKDVLLRGNKKNFTLGGMAILVPFANRIRGGKYTFEGKEYTLERNEEGNAIHGLILDKRFNVKEKSDDSVLLEYLLSNKGYPAKIRVEVSYALGESSLETKISVTNIDNTSAPLVVGAHPYFLVSDDWKIEPKKVKKCLAVNRIPTGKMIDFDLSTNREYDDCFYICNGLTLISSYSSIRISSNDMCFYQIYTGIKGAVAIEPMSGAPDAFNNKIGLKILKPHSTTSYSFTISYISLF
ncbi:MAG: aldose 1-epimerase [Caldisphaeraceae archaeon]|nr:aldose 1-epimerase [Caldisphaeraceae archaeon]MEB3797631.1 aldose 1-epimerase [Caldisphaeraceae archaeon]